jgi:uncharacterized protein (TIGR00730 family)
LNGAERIRRICVFCGSSTGIDPRYREAAEELARVIVASGRGIVYGGGSVGLMGVLADAALREGGEVIGVIPEVLAREELLHTGLTETHVVKTMHARKALMAERADAFVAMPGGFGTFEELLEIVTWRQLHFHSKPVGLLNVAGYYDGLVDLVDHAIEQGFIRRGHEALLLVEESPQALLARLEAPLATVAPKWPELETPS